MIRTALAICVGAAVLEGLMAGPGVRARLGELRMPRWSPPFQVWIGIGGVYYVICFLVLYRLFGLQPSGRRTIAVGLLLTVLLFNAVWNYLFFRARDLRASFVLSAGYSVVAVGLLIALVSLDRTAALVFLPYVVYLVYANGWGYEVWRANK